jgi:hypothetical protein
VIKEWIHKIFSVTERDFEQFALTIFRFQAAQNPVYRDYINALGVYPANIHSLRQIPFLPIQFFKTHRVASTEMPARIVFRSSGTTGTTSSKHYVSDLGLYETSFTKCFEIFYGPVKNWCIIGLLPSYLERKNASLVYMTEELIRRSGHPQSGFYLNETKPLARKLAELENQQQKTWLIGVTFALLDFARDCPQPLRHTVVVETGGMKGREREMIRYEVHDILKNAFQLPSVQSEYGMTELLSQAYSKGEGRFYTPPWMKMLVRDDEDPFHIKHEGAGALNVIDLANLYSCSFIATDDAGRLNNDGSFEVLGRVEGSDLRGCSLLTS